MITCVITNDTDPNRRDLFGQYARNREQCSPRRGADLIGHIRCESRLFVRLASAPHGGRA